MFPNILSKVFKVPLETYYLFRNIYDLNRMYQNVIKWKAFSPLFIFPRNYYQS